MSPSSEHRTLLIESQKRREQNVPRTLDNMREHDPTIIPLAGPSNGLTSEDQEEIAADIASDPFSEYFAADGPTTPPKILITTSPRATRVTYEFCDELVGVFPGAEFIRRKKGKGFEMGRIAGWAAGRGYKHLLVVNENMKKPSKCARHRIARFANDVNCRCHHICLSAQWADGLFQAYIHRIDKRYLCTSHGWREDNELMLMT